MASSNLLYDEIGGDAQFALGRAATAAVTNLVNGDEERLVALEDVCPHIPGEQDDDDVRAIAPIDVLRALVADYEAGQ